MNELVQVLAAELPRAVRWSGALARQLRRHDISLSGKHSGSADTDALTLADLSVQEILVAALRDMGPLVRRCRIEAEEGTGDLARFAERSDWVLAIDPIDGTREYRDRTGQRYAVMLHLRAADTIHYSLVYLPEEGAEGTWLEVGDDHIVLGADDWTVSARAALDAVPPIALNRRPQSRRILVSGFLGREAERARAVSAAGLEGILGSDTPGSLFPLMASGYLGGALFHTPNVYDFPVCMHVARVFGGDAVWVHDGRRVDFRRTWRDARANMVRLPGIVACASDPAIMPPLIEVARGWSPERYQ